jgi:hypothetical protein
MKPLLKYHEIRGKLEQIARGQLDRDSLQQLDLHPSDAAMLEVHMPSTTPATRAGNHAVPDELGRIAASLEGKLSGSALNDPLGFLLNGPLDSLCALLDADDFNTVLNYRNKRGTQP